MNVFHANITSYICMVTMLLSINYYSVPSVSLMMLGEIKWNVQIMSVSSKCASSVKNQ